MITTQVTCPIGIYSVGEPAASAVRAAPLGIVREVSTGLRERKKVQTRERLQRTALELFLRQGFEQTSVEQIVSVVDVSASTFFRYFPTKEDLVMSAGPDTMVVAAIASRPATETPLESLRYGLTAAFGPTANGDHSPAIERARLILATPSLRARLWEGQAGTAAELAEIFARRAGRRPDDLAVLVVATTCATAIGTAFLAWIATDGARSLPELINGVVDVLESGLELPVL
jgi:AcrR family transcriptional regulator